MNPPNKKSTSGRKTSQSASNFKYYLLLVLFKKKFDVIDFLLNNDCCPTMLVFNSAILDATEGIKQLL